MSERQDMGASDVKRRLTEQQWEYVVFGPYPHWTLTRRALVKRGIYEDDGKTLTFLGEAVRRLALADLPKPHPAPEVAGDAQPPETPNMTERSEDALKACPFCGCETVRQFHPFEQRGYVIDCNRCNGGFHNIPQDQAIKRWNTRSEASSPVIDEELCERARRVDRWLDAGCSSWGTPTQDIRALTRAALETGCAGLVAENARLTALVESMGGGCDANNGGLHSAMNQGREWFCPDCGLMLNRVAYVLPHIKPTETRTALRGDREQGEG